MKSDVLMQKQLNSVKSTQDINPNYKHCNFTYKLEDLKMKLSEYQSGNNFL